jgi:hypothetical protein
MLEPEDEPPPKGEPDPPFNRARIEAISGVPEPDPGAPEPGEFDPEIALGAIPVPVLVVAVPGVLAEPD